MTTVTDVSARFVDEYATLDPVRAARLMGRGLHGRDMTDYSPDGVARLRELLARTQRDVSAAAVVDEKDRLGQLFLTDQVGGELGLIDAGERERSMSIIAGPPASVRMLFDLVAPSSADDWDGVTARLEQVPAVIRGYRAMLEEGLSHTRVASRRCAEAVAEQCAVWAGRDGNGWFSTFARGRDEADGSDDGRERTARAAAAADAAYGALSDWVRHDYLPKATDVEGVGDERYRVWARAMLGTELDLDDAYQWGWEELARLEQAQAAESEQVRPGATSFAEVRELLLTDPDRAIDGVEEWRTWLQDVTDRAIDMLDGTHFDIPTPIRRCEVCIPPEGTAAAPYYTPPSEDLSQPGRTWFPPIGRTRFPRWDGVTTVFHEAVPGHHLQFGATRLVDLSPAQQFGFNSAHGEGWALYAERLMDELGQFETPDYRLGFLSMQAFRAVRVVIDIGIHTGRPIPPGRPHGGADWTYEIAVELLERASGMSREFCESEVLRYLSWPAQATCYKLGERAWLAGRDDARRAASNGFDLKDWHTRALALGPLGLDDLGRELARLAAP